MARDLSAYDVTDITASNANLLGYEDYHRGLAVQYRGEWIAWADNLDHAARIIGEDVGQEVRLVAVRHSQWEPVADGPVGSSEQEGRR